MKILILGGGALGSNLIANLCADLPHEHEITVLDYDDVEERNLRNQFYTPRYIGVPKVEALQDLLYEWYEREISSINEKLTPGNLHLLEGYSLVIDCFDNYGSRLLPQAMYLSSRVNEGFDLLHVGFSKDMTFAIEWAKNYQVPSDITSGFDICEIAGAGSFIKMVAALASQVVQEYVSIGAMREFVGSKFSIREIK